ncbi:hypothetical protein VTJ83DRAFT_5407 [Remersonia thermophila]|uniref:Uncharacterized protein n=1 Tax=Remersonia thermophila TaxID=72144 RepID=A0ABR4D7J3_9PEZI
MASSHPQAPPSWGGEADPRSMQHVWRNHGSCHDEHVGGSSPWGCSPSSHPFVDVVGVPEGVSRFGNGHQRVAPENGDVAQPEERHSMASASHVVLDAALDDITDALPSITSTRDASKLLWSAPPRAKTLRVVFCSSAARGRSQARHLSAVHRMGWALRLGELQRCLGGYAALLSRYRRGGGDGLGEQAVAAKIAEKKKRHLHLQDARRGPTDPIQSGALSRVRCR